MISFWANCFPTVRSMLCLPALPPPPPRCPNYVEGQGYRKLDWLHHTKVALYMFYDVLKFINHDCTIPDHEFDVSWSNFLAVWTDSQPFCCPHHRFCHWKVQTWKKSLRVFMNCTWQRWRYLQPHQPWPTPVLDVGHRMVKAVGVTGFATSEWDSPTRAKARPERLGVIFFESHSKVFFFSGDFLE